jgi:hypothetical protein
MRQSRFPLGRTDKAYNMGLIDGQVGDQYDSSTTNVHVLEFHQSTALTIIGIAALLAALTGGLWYYCRRKYREKQMRQGRQLALTYQGCTCGAAAGAAAFQNATQHYHRRSRSRSRSLTDGRGQHVGAIRVP